MRGDRTVFMVDCVPSGEAWKVVKKAFSVEDSVSFLGFPTGPLSQFCYSGYSLGIPSSAPGHQVQLQPLGYTFSIQARDDSMVAFFLHT